PRIHLADHVAFCHWNSTFTWKLLQDGFTTKNNRNIHIKLVYHICSHFYYRYCHCRLCSRLAGRFGRDNRTGVLYASSGRNVVHAIYVGDCLLLSPSTVEPTYLLL